MVSSGKEANAGILENRRKAWQKTIRAEKSGFSYKEKSKEYKWEGWDLKKVSSQHDEGEEKVHRLRKKKTGWPGATGGKSHSKT